MVDVWTIPRHLILLYVSTKPDPRSYGIRRATRIEASQDPGALLHRTRDQFLPVRVFGPVTYFTPQVEDINHQINDNEETLI